MLNASAGESGPRRPALVVLGLVDLVSRYVLILCMTVMVVAVSTNVLLRYGFNSSIDWADELSRLMFVWIVFLAMPHGVKHGIHVGLDIVRARMTPAVQRMLDRLVRGILFVFLAVAAWQSGAMMLRNWDTLMVTMDLPAGLFYLAIAFGCAHALPHLIVGPAPPAEVGAEALQ